MKNFPDHDPFNEVEKRLQGYTEQPDELVWRNIDASLRPRRPMAWIPWLDHFTFALSTLLFAWVMAMNQSNDISAYVEKHGQEQLKAPHQEEEILSANDHQHSDQNKAYVEKNQTASSTLPYGKKFLALNANSSNAGPEISLGKEGGILDTTIVYSDHANQIESKLPSESDSLLLSSTETQMDSLMKDPQEIQKKEHRRKKRITFYAVATPGLSFHRAIPMQRDGVVVNDISNPSILSAERFGFSIEAGVQGYVTQRLEYYAGFSVYQQTQSLRYSYQSDNAVNIESAEEKNYTITPKSSIGMVRYNMMNVGLQAGMLYHLYGKNLAHKIGAGVSYQQGMKKGNAEVYDNSESSYLSYQLFYRNELRINKRLRVFVQPTFTQSIRVREELNAPFRLKPYRAGIGFGILYNF